MKLFYGGGEKILKELPAAYKTVADASGCHFLDATTIVKASRIDGVHLDPDAHRALAAAIRKSVLSITREGDT